MVEISSAIKCNLYLKFKGRCDGQFFEYPGCLRFCLSFPSIQIAAICCKLSHYQTFTPSLYVVFIYWMFQISLNQKEDKQERLWNGNRSNEHGYLRECKIELHYKQILWIF